MLNFGTDDRIEKYILNSAGYITQTETDVTNDGKVDKVTLYTLDVHGNVLQKLDYNRSYDAQGVATDTLVQKEVYSVDSNGHTVGMTRYMGSSTQPIVVETYEVNALGQSTKALIDNYGDNVIDRAEIYTLDANGYRTKMESDVGNDDSIESQRKYERDAIGRLLVEHIDSTNDDTFESKKVFTKDAYGNDVKVETYSDGQLGQIVSRTFDNYGRAISEIIDRDGKGLGTVSGDRDERYEMSYNEFGQQYQVKSYLNITELDKVGTYEATTTRIFDEFSRISVEKTERADGSIDYVYKEYGNLWNKPISEEKYNAKNELTHRIEFVMNQNGEIILSYQDNDISRQGFEILDFGQYGINHKEDLTTWDTEQLAKVKGILNVILSKESNKSEIVFDKATIKAIAADDSGHTIWIRGDSTDTVSFKNTQSEFNLTKGVETSDKTFDQYTFNDNGVDYHLRIADDVNVNFGVL